MKLVAKVEPDVTAWGDEVRIVQVLANLISNAVRYTPKGWTISITVRTTPEHVEVSVQDDGIGFTAEQLGSVAMA